MSGKKSGKNPHHGLVNLTPCQNNTEIMGGKMKVIIKTYSNISVKNKRKQEWQHLNSTSRDSENFGLI